MFSQYHTGWVGKRFTKAKKDRITMPRVGICESSGLPIDIFSYYIYIEIIV